MNTSMTDADVLKCLMMPLESFNLLLPNVMVAEVVPSRKVEQLNSAPHWLLGQFEWCGLDIPLICFEELCGTGGMKAGRGRIVVLYALSSHCVYGYYGLYMRDIPKFFSL
ncbi:MAG: chemotaxis protein CheW, partial [Gammaproteobacteria bacterium]|nr:chemotaxis protein CheW [Gammaproteobacteria bacterium]